MGLKNNLNSKWPAAKLTVSWAWNFAWTYYAFFVPTRNLHKERAYLAKIQQGFTLPDYPIGARESTPNPRGGGIPAHSFEVYNPSSSVAAAAGGKWRGSVDDAIFVDQSGGSAAAAAGHHITGGGYGTVRRKAKRERNKTTDAVQIVHAGGSMGR